MFSDFLNLFFFDRTHGIGGVLKALQSTGGFQSLAEPNLIAYNGQEASFLAGGEFPIPVVQGLPDSVTVVFKEFGIRLNFKPTIAGDVIRLKVRPEVSSLDFNNGLTLSGFRIPSLITRRAETDVELRDGQTFAIAGLMNNISQNDAAAIPVLSKLPIIGPLFKSKSKRAEQTELMVLITPRLVRPLEPDEVPPLPTDPKLFIDKDSDAQRGRRRERSSSKAAPASSTRRGRATPASQAVTGDEDHAHSSSIGARRRPDHGGGGDGRPPRLRRIRHRLRRDVDRPRPGSDVGRCRSARRRDLAGVRQPDRFRRREDQGASRGAREQRVGAGAGRPVDGRHVPAVPAGRSRPAGHLREGGRVSQSGAGQPVADVFRQPRRDHGPGRAGRPPPRRSSPATRPTASSRGRSSTAGSSSARGPGMLPTSTYDKYSDGKGQAPPQENDVYIPPSATSTGHRVHAARPIWAAGLP